MLRSAMEIQWKSNRNLLTLVRDHSNRSSKDSGSSSSFSPRRRCSRRHAENAEFYRARPRLSLLRIHRCICAEVTCARAQAGRTSLAAISYAGRADNSFADADSRAPCSGRSHPRRSVVCTPNGCVLMTPAGFKILSKTRRSGGGVSRRPDTASPFPVTHR